MNVLFECMFSYQRHILSLIAKASCRTELEARSHLNRFFCRIRAPYAWLVVAITGPSCSITVFGPHGVYKEGKCSVHITPSKMTRDSRYQIEVHDQPLFSHCRTLFSSENCTSSQRRILYIAFSNDTKIGCLRALKIAKLTIEISVSNPRSLK